MSSRLLLDEMYPPEIARQLARRGHDVLAVVADPLLVALPDHKIIALAAEDHRCLMTENWSDFEELRDTWEKDQKVHGGLLYTNPKRFPRNRQNLGPIIVALDRMITGGQLPGPGEVRWLC